MICAEPGGAVNEIDTDDSVDPVRESPVGAAEIVDAATAADTLLTFHGFGPFTVLNRSE